MARGQKLMLKKLSYITFGLVLAFLGYAIFLDARSQIYLWTPVSNVFNAHVVVPDYNLGDNPQVQYDRTINQEFVGDFTVKLMDVKTGISECYGEGRGFHYDPNTPVIVNNDTLDTLDWYMNSDCSHNPNVTTGQHFLETTWTIHREGLPDKYFSVDSNIFNIYPTGTKPALTSK